MWLSQLVNNATFAFPGTWQYTEVEVLAFVPSKISSMVVAVYETIQQTRPEAVTNQRQMHDGVVYHMELAGRT